MKGEGDHFRWPVVTWSLGDASSARQITDMRKLLCPIATRCPTMIASKSIFALHFLAFALLLGFCASGRAQQKIPPGVEVLADVEYGSVGGRAPPLED
jgi:hypothetical protein